MNTYAAAMTGKGTGAISTIQVFGDKAEIVLKKIFRQAGTKPAKFRMGEILLGQITNGSETIDQVTIGCETAHSLAINCHGNPLIVADIMQLLGRHGVKLLTVEELLAKILSAQKSTNTIALEAKLAQLKAKTIEGAKIIANQIDGGLSKIATDWLQNINRIPLSKIKNCAKRILETSQAAKLIIYGCKAAIAGPPNTGKSTLLNCLCGRQKAIVTDIKGTTRDWVSARCQIGSLSVELIDTAGLNEKLAAESDTLDKESQMRAVRILEDADLVLLVLDNSQIAEQLDGKLLEKIADKKILAVLNKSDLTTRFNADRLPKILTDTVKISAKLETGIVELTEKIRQLCGAADFNLHTTVCITSRQENLLRQLKKVKSKKQAASIITELLNGQLSV